MELPTTVADPVKRMRAVHERTDAMKKSPAAYINHYFGNFLYGMPFFTYFVNGLDKVCCFSVPLVLCAVVVSLDHAWAACAYACAWKLQLPACAHAYPCTQ